jgi:hypothetical protein
MPVFLRQPHLPMYHQNEQKMFCMILRIKINYFPEEHQVLFLYNGNAAFTEKQEIIVTHYVDMSHARESLVLSQAVNRGALSAETGVPAPIHFGIVVDIGSDTASSPINSGFPCQQHSTNITWSTFISAFKENFSKTSRDLQKSGIRK